MGVVPGRSEMKLSITKQSTQKLSLGSEVELFHLVPQFYSNCLCIVALVTRCYKIVVTRCAQRRANASSLSTSQGGRPTHRRLLQSAISKKPPKIGARPNNPKYWATNEWHCILGQHFWAFGTSSVTSCFLGKS